MGDVNENTQKQGGFCEIKKIFVVGPSWLGDMIMAQSLFMLLNQQYPNAKISVLAPAWCVDVLDRMPQVHESIVMPIGHGEFNFSKRRALAKSIQSSHFDLAIVMPGSFKSALIPWLAGIKQRRGFVGEQRYFLLNDIRKKTNELPLNVQHYAALAYGQHENWHALAKTPPWPSLKVDQNQQHQTLIKFALTTSRPILTLCPGAEYGPAKRWPASYYAQVAKEMQAKGFQVWIFGSAKDEKIAQEITDLVDDKEHIYILAGKTSIGEAIDLMALSDWVVSNDSGLMHVAAALSLPLVAIYGSSSTRFTPPLSQTAHCVSLNLSCSPCFKRDCPLGHTNCLVQLMPEKVLSYMGESQQKSEQT